MPLPRIRSVTIALGAALVVLLIPLGLTLHELLRLGGVAAWLRLGALLAAFAAVGTALQRQRSIRALIAERQRLDVERLASDAMFADILAIAADAVVTVDEEPRISPFT